MKTLALAVLSLASFALAGPEEWIGKTVPELVLADGKVYQRVTFRSITPATIVILHETGGATIPIEKLTPEAHAALGLDPKTAEKFRKEQAAAAMKKQIRDQARARERARQQRINEATRTIVFDIDQVLDSGLLVSEIVVEDPRGGGAALADDTIYIQMETADYNVYDGMRLELKAFPLAEPYQFITVLGATRTVPAWQHVPKE